MIDAATVAMILWVALRERDRPTATHSRRVGRTAHRLASRLGCSNDECKAIFQAGLLHDIGKLGLRDDILRGTGSLDERERMSMKLHVERGVRLLSRYPVLFPLVPIVATHHERPDGCGYPAGVSEIPVGGRILAICDVFDALTHARSYKEPFSSERACRILEDGRGTQFDPELLDAFLEMVRTTGRSVPACVVAESTSTPGNGSGGNA